MAAIISVEDLQAFKPDIEPVKAQAMIDDALAMAVRVAPCITDDDFTEQAAAKAILRGALLRWEEAGTGAMSSTNLQAGPFGQQQTVDTRQARRSMFWPSEITDLQHLCQDSQEAKAFSVDTAPTGVSEHLPWCSVNFGASYCSCGVDIAGMAIFEMGK